MCGVKDDDTITTVENSRGEGVEPGCRWVDGLSKEGWVYFLDYDDFCLALYKDGEPVGAIVMACDVGFFSAEAYLAKTDKRYIARVGFGIPAEWREVDSPTSQKAKDWLMG